MGTQITASAQISSNYDDATSGPDDFWPNNYNCNFMGHSNGYGFLNAGLRFNNIQIPKGSTISSAKISVYSDFPEYYSDDANGILYGEAADNPSAFADTSREPHLLTTTTASVEWNPSAWADTTWYDSPDISSIITEIVNREGWKSGNSLCILWKQNMPEEYSSNAFVSFVDYNGSTTLCPKLEIEYQIKQNTISTSFLLNGGLARFTGGMR